MSFNLIPNSAGAVSHTHKLSSLLFTPAPLHQKPRVRLSIQSRRSHFAGLGSDLEEDDDNDADGDLLDDDDEDVNQDLGSDLSLNDL